MQNRIFVSFEPQSCDRLASEPLREPSEGWPAVGGHDFRRKSARKMDAVWLKDIGSRGLGARLGWAVEIGGKED